MTTEALPPEQYESPGHFVMDHGQEDTAPERLHIAGGSADPVKDYLRIIGRTPLLSAELEVELSKDIEAGLLAGHLLTLREKANQGQELSEQERELQSRWRGKVTLSNLEELAQKGDVAKQQMLEANLRLVVSIAKKYTGRGMPFLDLIQEGNTGLIRAVEKFDFEKGYKFSTYGTWWIRQAITRELANQARVIRIPVHMTEKINTMEQLERRMTQDTGVAPSIEELAAELGETPETVTAYKRYAQSVISLETPIGDGTNGETSLGDLIEDPEAIHPDDVVEFSDLQKALQQILYTLTEREADVIAMRYGLTDGVSRKLEEVGKKLGVSPERVRQIEAKTMSKLRHPARSGQLREFIG